MPLLVIPWAPRMILTGRVFRLPVQAPNAAVELDADDFERVADRWATRDSARYFYLRSPSAAGDYSICARFGDETTEVVVQVRALSNLRAPFVFNEAQWPRRWPLGNAIATTKGRQTMQDVPVGTVDETTAKWWLAQSDVVVWTQLPNAEMPRAHFVNVHQGSPTVGTAIFKHGGFYPWRRSHLPCDFKSVCPASGDVFPSNDLAHGDYVSGEFVDDGYGYFDADGHVFLFAATYTRDQFRAFGTGISTLTTHLRRRWDDDVARTLCLMLLRYAQEECYVAAVPQFRYGPTKGVEEPWDWGQPDWGAMDDPVEALVRMGSLRYCIDTPYIAETLALAYDTVWPFLKTDRELVDRAQAQGLMIDAPEDGIQLIEEMLACLLQCILDRGAGSNLPRESQGALALLRALDRSDAQDVMDWLYDEGPDTLRVFTTNDFLPDGMPPESTGGYNGIHTNGVFDLEDQLCQLRALHPEAYPESRYPSLMDDPRAARIARAPHEIVMGGKTWFQFGDGSAPGSSAQLGGPQGKADTIAIEPDCFHAPMAPETLDRAVGFTGDETVREIRDAAQNGTHRPMGSTLLDGAGIAILRTDEAPERAAAGIVYGDTTGHRHRDLLDVQLVAFGRPFLTDLGYPQSWASIANWEAHWATHNTVWGVLEGETDARIAGRGRLVRALLTDGAQALDVAAGRWIWNGEAWIKTNVSYRRLIALVETDGDGVALVDLSRIRGGTTHWRTCRGLEGDFETVNLALTPRSGTVAGAEIARGELDRLRHPDDTALAYMDDVTAAPVGDKVWRGAWRSRRESDVHLDLYQLHASDDTDVLTARATAVMGAPDASNYDFRSLLWRRTPVSDDDVTLVDLVFEPRVGDPTLAGVWWCGKGTSAAVRLETQSGREISIYWAPDGGTEFPDGSWMDDGLGVVVDNTAVSVGAQWFGGLVGENARMQRSVHALDRNACTVDVDVIDDLEPGDLVVLHPGRGHVYEVTHIAALSDNRQRLTLDMTSVLGRAQVAQIKGDHIMLSHHIMARTGYLHGARLERGSDGLSREIVAAHNPDRRTTALRVNAAGGEAFKEGDWVQVVDYGVGDTLYFEPQL